MKAPRDTFWLLQRFRRESRNYGCLFRNRAVIKLLAGKCNLNCNIRRRTQERIPGSSYLRTHNMYCKFYPRYSHTYWELVEVRSPWQKGARKIQCYGVWVLLALVIACSSSVFVSKNVTA
jgi:hypothetical protein